ncbi:uncharacterized protein LOC117115380 isoform X1 [Anneissia japonica]|uniref:uncharacterized protein LOC117115380 isoform X1 n=1 Tax=Anneissia japonica TaxID=1529436 RepID=UPI0014255AAE|nr:uncharacterized protein LOC117115380 isoform X1 [Anneissia japonica]
MDKEFTTIKPDTTVEVHLTSKTEAEKSTPIVEVIEAKPTTPMPIKTDVDEQSVKPIDLATTSDPIVEEKISATTQSVTPMQQPDVVQMTTGESVAVMKTDKETSESTSSDSIAHTTISLSKVTMSEELVDELGSGVEKNIISPTNETKFKSDKPMQVIDVFTTTARPVEVASTTAKAITVQQNTYAVEKLLTSLKPESSAFVDVSTTPKVTNIVSEEQDIVFGSGVEVKLTSEKLPGFMSTFKPTPIPSKVYKPTPEVDVIDGFTQKHLTDVKSIKDDKTQVPQNIDKMDKELTTIKPDTTVEVHLTSKTEAEKSTPIVEVIEAKPTTPMPIKTDVDEQSVKPIDLATTSDPIVEEKISATTQSVTPMQQPDVVQTTTGESVAVMKTDKETSESTSSDSIAHTTISLRKVTVSQELVDELGSGVDKTIISPTNETKFKSDKPIQVIDVFTTTARPVEVASTTAKAITVQQNTDAVEKLLTSLKPESSAFSNVSTIPKVTDIVSEEQDIVFGSGVEGKLTSEKVPGFMSTLKPTPIPSKVYKPTPEVDVIDGFTQKHLTDVKSIKDDKTQAPKNSDKIDKELTTIKPDTTVEVHLTSKTEAEKLTPIVEVIEAKPTTPMPIKTDVDEQSVSPSVKPIDLATTSEPIVEGEKLSATTQSVKPMQQPDVVQTTTGESVAVMKTDKETLESTSSDSIAHTTFSLSKVTMSQELIDELGSGVDKTIISPTNETKFKSDKPMQVIDVFTTTARTVEVASTTAKAITVQQNTDAVEKLLTSLKPESSAFFDVSTMPKVTDIVSEEQDIVFGSGVEGKVTSEKVPGFMSTFKPTPIPSKVYKPTPEVDVIDGFTQKHLTDAKSIKDDKTQVPQNIDKMDKELTTIKPDTTVEVHLTSKKEAEKSTPIVEIIEAKLTTLIPSKGHIPTSEADVIDGFTMKHVTDAKSMKDAKMQAPENIDKVRKEVTTIKPITKVEVQQTTLTAAEKSTPIVEVIESKHATGISNFTGKENSTIYTLRPTELHTVVNVVGENVFTVAPIQQPDEHTMLKELVDELGSGVDIESATPVSHVLKLTSTIVTSIRNIEDNKHMLSKDNFNLTEDIRFQTEHPHEENSSDTGKGRSTPTLKEILMKQFTTLPTDKHDALSGIPTSEILRPTETALESKVSKLESLTTALRNLNSHLITEEPVSIEGCFEECSMLYEPVCGTDKHTYPNRCTLEGMACQFPGYHLTIDHLGPCVEVALKTHARDINLGSGMGSLTVEIRDTADCEQTCHAHQPVCGNDRSTYLSECALKKYACTANISGLKKAYDGECIEEISKIFEGSGRCDQVICPGNYDPVCSNNGFTFANDCDLLFAKLCLGMEDIQKSYHGSC